MSSMTNNGNANKWFENSAHPTTTNASDRIKKVRNRAIYQNTMNIASQGGMKRGYSTRPAMYTPATLLNSKCVTNDCVSFFIRSAPSYENLLRTTQGVYEGRARQMAQGTIPRTYKPPTTQTNGDIVRRVTSSNPLSETSQYNYLNLNTSTDLLILSKADSQNAAYDASHKMAIDPAACMQYPPNPSLSITYGGGGCFAPT